ncbi:MAG TPA: helix-turn-helix transcriptional regulator [Actinomycetota bacterium]|nr:helix-turn-helix transcriptional regulator [Actinomycetota bacterium]
MNGGAVIRRARLRAGISQAELARRLGSKQPVVARWETGARSPSLETVARAVEACGLALDVAVVDRDEGEDALLREWQRLSPAERMRRNEEMLRTEEWLRRARRVGEGAERARG